MLEGDGDNRFEVMAKTAHGMIFDQHRDELDDGDGRKMRGFATVKG